MITVKYVLYHIMINVFSKTQSDSVDIIQIERVSLSQVCAAHCVSPL